MTPYHDDGRVTLYLGDCREVMASMDAESVDAIVTDPPYGLSFMGKGWDHGVPGVEFWQAAARVAKPGAHLLAFGGTRTYHRLACAIEDAGWEIRDCIMWVYGSGFPKSLDVSKAIDKAAGAEREVVGRSTNQVGVGWADAGQAGYKPEFNITAPATDAAREWGGWGTALKPAVEPIVVARKPLDGTVAANVLKWGTGAINVDASRIPGGMDDTPETWAAKGAGGRGSARIGQNNDAQREAYARGDIPLPAGRWPANLIHDGSDEVVAGFPVSSAARFFYVPKADSTERHSGGEGSNGHPCVKPVDLMRYLIRLVTRPGGTVLDPFVGSGTTAVAAKYGGHGWRCVGIDIGADHLDIAAARLAQETLV